MELKEYLSVYGRVKKLADAVGITSPMVSMYKTGVRKIPIKLAPRIEKATKGQVTRKDMFPTDYAKYWPELDDK